MALRDRGRFQSLGFKCFAQAVMLGPTTWVIVTEQVLPIAVAFGFALAWTIILVRLRAT
jgi:hypothetical protein